MKHIKEFNTPHQLIVELPLYEPISVVPDDPNAESDIPFAMKVLEFEFFNGVVDLYCVECKLQRTYRRSNFEPVRISGRLTEKYTEWDTGQQNYAQRVKRKFEVELKCVHDSSHTAWFYYFFDTSALIKVGQYPSIADLSFEHLNEYLPIIGEDNLRELKKGMGLFAHGVGIGAFVYPRRLLEKLIEEAHIEASKTEGWDEVEYQTLRVVERIQALKDVLPKFLYENAQLYSILSKGIHELTEEECLEHFRLIQHGIEAILDEKLVERRKKAKNKALSADIQKLHEKLKTTDGGEKK